MYFPTGYRMMFDYLDSLYQRTRADELGGLLGYMSLLGDGEPAGPAYGPDWKRAVRQAETALGQGFPPSELAYESVGIIPNREWDNRSHTSEGRTKALKE